MSSRQLAVPTFVSGPTDDLATVDVYAKADASVINKIPEITVTPTVSTSSIDALRGGPSLLSKLPSLSSITSTIKSAASLVTAGGLLAKLATSKGDLLSRVTGASSVISGALRGLSPSTLSGVLGGGISSLGSISKIAVSVGGITKVIKGGNIAQIGQVGNLMTSITGNTGAFKLLDQSANIGLLCGTVKSACAAGIPNSFGALSGTLTKVSDINKFGGGVLSSVVKYSDLGSLTSIAQQTSPGSMAMLQPSILSDFGRAYAPPATQTAAQVPENFLNITSTYDKLQPDWNTMSRVTPMGVDQAVNLTALQGSSPDFLKTIEIGSMNSTNPTEKLYPLAAVYPPTDVSTQLSQQFPTTTPVTSVMALSPPVTTTTTVTQTTSTTTTSTWLDTSVTKTVDPQAMEADPIKQKRDEINAQIADIKAKFVVIRARADAISAEAEAAKSAGNMALYDKLKLAETQVRQGPEAEALLTENRRLKQALSDLDYSHSTSVGIVTIK